MARTAELGFTALSIYGGLLPAAFLHTVAKLEAGSQEPATYGVRRSFNCATRSAAISVSHPSSGQTFSPFAL